MAFSTSSKLSAAQSELQTCELQLAAKERELVSSRTAALREGLGGRLKALVDCGWVWGELGKEGLRSLDALQFDSKAAGDRQHPKGTDTDSFIVNATSESGYSSIGPSQSASQINHDHHNAEAPIFRSFDSSELPSAPPLDAELSTATIRPISMATTNTVTTTGTFSGSGTSTPAHAALLAATTSTLTYAPAVAVRIPPSSPPSAVGASSEVHAMEAVAETNNHSEVHLPIPPPHALGSEYVNIPLAEMVGAVKARLGEVAGDRSSSPSKPSSSDKTNKRDDELDQHKTFALVDKRITEGAMVGNDEDDRVHNVENGYVPEVGLPADELAKEHMETVDSGEEVNTPDRHDHKAHESSSDEIRGSHKLEVVENPRFMSEKQKREAEEKLTRGKDREGKPFGSPQLGAHATSDKNAKASSSKTFFGSLRGLFGSRDKTSTPASRSKQKSRATAPDSSDPDASSSDDDWPSPATQTRKKGLKTLIFRPADKKTVSSGAKLELGRGSLDSWNGSANGPGSRSTGFGGSSPIGSKLRGAAVGVKRAGVTSGKVKAGSVDKLELAATGKQGVHKGRTRASSDVGTSIAGGSQSHSRQERKRLKKNRIQVVASGAANESSGSDLDVRGSADKPIMAGGGPPLAGSAAMAKARWLTDYPAPDFPSSFDQIHIIEKPATSRRSNSVDIGVASRRKEKRESYVLVDHRGKDGVGEERPSSPTSSKGQIIDLGESRAREKEREREETVQKARKDEKSPSNSTALRSFVHGTGKPSRSSSLSSSRKVTTVLAVHSNEAASNWRQSRDSSLRIKGGGDIGMSKRTDILGQSSFSSASAKTATSSSRLVGLPGSPTPTSTPKSASGTGVGPTSKPTTVTASGSANLIIVEDVKRPGQISTSVSAKARPMPMEVAKAPPRATREGLENFVAQTGAGGNDEIKSAGSVLFQIQAPGSVFDQKPTDNTGSKGSSAVTSPSTSALGVAAQQRHGQAMKTPLKSALKNTSRTPSPSPLALPAPLPFVVSAPSARDSTMMNSITHVGLPLSTTGQADADVGSESGEEEFFTDEGEPNGESLSANDHVDSPTTQPASTTIRTVLPTPNEQTPRKRKSVRVSLKPTFSPSPPAVEYDEEENSDARTSSHHLLKPNIPSSSKHKQMSPHHKGMQSERWEDSSDEDEEYRNARAALSRAARKDKEVSLSVFGY